VKFGAHLSVRPLDKGAPVRGERGSAGTFGLIEPGPLARLVNARGVRHVALAAMR